jgi:hypothetical protein
VWPLTFSENFVMTLPLRLDNWDGGIRMSGMPKKRISYQFTALRGG